MSSCGSVFDLSFGGVINVTQSTLFKFLVKAILRTSDIFNSNYLNIFLIDSGTSAKSFLFSSGINTFLIPAL